MMVELVIFVTVTAVGLAVALWTHHEAVLDRQAVNQADITDGRRIAMRDRVRRAKVRVIVFAAWLLTVAATLSGELFDNRVVSLPIARTLLIFATLVYTWDTVSEARTLRHLSDLQRRPDPS